MKKTVKIALIHVGITHGSSLKYKYKQVLKKIKIDDVYVSDLRRFLIDQGI